jgi:hypothetical protein
MPRHKRQVPKNTALKVGYCRAAELGWGSVEDAHNDETSMCKRCEQHQNSITAVHCLGWRLTQERCEECGAYLWEEIL